MRRIGTAVSSTDNYGSRCRNLRRGEKEKSIHCGVGIGRRCIYQVQHKLAGASLMMNTNGSETSTTLLGRLALFPLDQAAWEEFVRRYGPSVLDWCRRWGAQEADALDVSQVVLSKLAVQMRHFAYDPSRSFRSWLRAVALNAWRDSLDARRPDAASGETEMVERLSGAEAAARLGMSVAAVFTAKASVLRMLREETHDLEGGPDSDQAAEDHP